MTPDLAALGWRAVACRGWEWRPGMACWVATYDGSTMSRPWRERIDEGESEPRAVRREGCALLGPDLSDGPTRGALLDLVREAWGGDVCTGPLFVVGIGFRWTLVGLHRASMAEARARGWATEAEALVAALEAAP